MLKTSLALAVCITAAAAKDYVWNGASSGFNSPAAWDGPAPQNDDGKIPTYVVFGSDQKGKQAVASVPASKDPYNMGSKIVFNGAGKIVLGDGSSGKKTTLRFEKGNDGVSTFLPGSGQSTKDDADTKKKLQKFDINCHRNWVPTADEDSVALKPPCSGDKGYFVSDSSNERFKVQPTNFNSGDMFWASNYKVSNDAKFYVQEDVDSKAKAKNADDCTDGGSIVTGLGVLDLQRCGKETTFGEDEGFVGDKCKSTCPPFAVLSDGSYVQSDENDEDGNPVFKRIDEKGVPSDDKVEMDKGQEAFTISSKDGKTVQKYEGKGGNFATVAPTTVPTTVEATADAPSTVTKKPKTTKGPGGTGAPGDGDDDDDLLNDDKDDDADPDKSIGDDKDDSGSGMLVIVIVIVIVLIVGVVIGAVLYIKSQNNAGPRPGGVVSFENPMYDTQGNAKQNPIAGGGGFQQQQQQQGGGYQDVSGMQGGGTYAEPFQGQSASSGYMDVAPTNTGAQASGGYMDVAPGMSNANMADDDDGEDV